MKSLLHKPLVISAMVTVLMWVLAIGLQELRSAIGLASSFGAGLAWQKAWWCHCVGMGCTRWVVVGLRFQNTMFSKHHVFKTPCFQNIFLGDPMFVQMVLFCFSTVFCSRFGKHGARQLLGRSGF